MNKPTLFIPYVNREDLLARAWESVIDDFYVIVIDNGDKQDLMTTPTTYPYKIYTPDIPLNFVYTQNLMLKWANEKGLKWYGFMHNDAMAVGDTPQKLIEYTDNVKERWGVCFTHYDTLCTYNVEAMNAIGGWSKFFEQYYADVDLYRRFRLAGYATLDTGFPVEHYNGNDASATIQNDEKRAFRNHIVNGLYARMYELRWGGQTGNEKYNTPFNKGDITI